MARTFLKNLFCILSKNRANIFYQQEPCQLPWISKNTARMLMGWVVVLLWVKLKSQNTARMIVTCQSG
jgi:hypothetical protein